MPREATFDSRNSQTSLQPGDPASMDETLTALPSTRPGNRLLMIYVHIPFCRSKCHFCDWVQAIPTSDLLLKSEDSQRKQYIDALCREIRVRGKELSQNGYVPYILYWGGGTASILDPSEIETVSQALRDAFDLSSVAEATIECSPDTISLEKLRLFRQLGFQRFSSGVQALEDSRLRKLGRTHSADSAIQAVQWAVEAGFEDINIDLMCGFPGETLVEVEQTMSRGLALPITHISVYPFRPTAGTMLRRQIDRQRSELFMAQQMAAFTLARKIAAAAGFSEYASGYFGKTGPALNVIMPFQLRLETVGFGSGAISVLDRKYHGHSKGLLHQYVADPLNWDFSAPASSPPVAFSFLQSGLSIFDGILRDEWQGATGVSLDETLAHPNLRPLIDKLRTSNSLIEDSRGIRLPRERAGHILVNMSFTRSMAQT
jgi:coproporphyrinogen III oxidase-like Fe-S oxidoreductase